MKVNEILGEDLYQKTLADLDGPKKDLPPSKRKSPQSDFKAGWQQGKKIGQKVLNNPVVNTLKKIDAWANRRSK